MAKKFWIVGVVVVLFWAQPALALYVGLNSDYDPSLPGYIIGGVEYNSPASACSFEYSPSYTADGVNTRLSLVNYFTELVTLSLSNREGFSQVSMASTATGASLPFSLYASNCLLHPDLGAAYGVQNVVKRDDAGEILYYYYPVGSIEVISSTPAEGGTGLSASVSMPLALAVKNTPQCPVYPVNAVPEPVSFVLFGLGAGAIAVSRRTRGN